ncbi:hypothetical protein [Rhodoglobus aureus]|uniref:hypothetical protein n=1 Tax=Rhodoglobus aureus TaxID=191497 RepID=UPI0031CEC946
MSEPEYAGLATSGPPGTLVLTTPQSVIQVHVKRRYGSRSIGLAHTRTSLLIPQAMTRGYVTVPRSIYGVSGAVAPNVRGAP